MAFLSKNRQTNVKLIADLLLLAGCPISSLPMVVAQVCFETGWFSNEGAIKLNNFSGIKYTSTLGKDGRPIQKNSKPDTSVVNDGGGGGRYAVFNTPLDWAKDHVRIINRGGANSPIMAGDVTTYVNRLIANKYFEGSPTVYLSNLKSIIKKHLSGVLPSGWSVATVLNATGTAVRSKLA